MTNLIERLEKLTGPDREVDFAILSATGWVLERRGRDKQEPVSND